MAESVRMFIMVGFLGALTTFSTFSMDIMVSIDRGQMIGGMIYTMVSVAGSVLIFILAAQMMRALKDNPMTDAPFHYRETDMRLDRMLRKRFDGLTQGVIEKSLRTGKIRVDGARIKASHRLGVGR